jgi:esterase/lipase superfamily enzyme
MMKSNTMSLIVCLLLALVGCSTKTYLMPTPNVYSHPDWNPFAGVPPALQHNKVSVLYVTDRVPEKQTPDHWAYGHKRSRSAAFGEAQVQIGNNLSWDGLVQASRSAKRKNDLALSVVSTNELGRFAPTPASLMIAESKFAHWEPPSDAVDAEVARRFTDALTARLSATPRKEVFLFVHGFDNTFEDAVVTIGEI